MGFHKKLIAAIVVANMICSVHVPGSLTAAAESYDVEIGENEDTSESTEYNMKPYKDVESNLNLVSKEDWENTDIGEYPINPDSDIWKELSGCESSAACNMPKEYAETLTTEELVEYAVNYPFLWSHMFAFDDIYSGIETLTTKSGVFEELFARADCYDKLLDKYADLNINYKELKENHDVSGTKYNAEVFIEVYMSMNYDLLSDEQAERFVKAYADKVSSMNDVGYDAATYMIGYRLIEDKIEDTPEKAILKRMNDGEDVDDDKDSIMINDKCDASAKAAIVTCGYCYASFLSTTLSINSSRVRAYQWISEGYTDEQIADDDRDIASRYPTYLKVASASSKYNCHSYAWYLASPSNEYWINNPDSVYSDTAYWTLWRPPMRSIQAGDRITFSNDSVLQHSAIAENSTECTSKLGHYGIYTTTINEMEALYNAPDIQVYIPYSLSEE